MPTRPGIGPFQGQEPGTPSGSPIWVARTQGLGPFSIAFPDLLVGNWIRVKQLELEPELIWDAPCTATPALGRCLHARVQRQGTEKSNMGNRYYFVNAGARQCKNATGTVLLKFPLWKTKFQLTLPTNPQLASYLQTEGFSVQISTNTNGAS